MLLNKQRLTNQQLSFGQRPRPDVSIYPPQGERGTIFQFNAVKFDVNIKVQISIVDSEKHVIYRQDIITDQKGSIGYSGLQLATNENFFTGQYQFIISGACMGKEETIVKSFNVM